MMYSTRDTETPMTSQRGVRLISLLELQKKLAGIDDFVFVMAMDQVRFETAHIDGSISSKKSCQQSATTARSSSTAPTPPAPPARSGPPCWPTRATPTSPATPAAWPSGPRPASQSSKDRWCRGRSFLPLGGRWIRQGNEGNEALLEYGRGKSPVTGTECTTAKGESALKRPVSTITAAGRCPGGVRRGGR